MITIKTTLSVFGVEEGNANLKQKESRYKTSVLSFDVRWLEMASSKNRNFHLSEMGEKNNEEGDKRGAPVYRVRQKK